MSNPLLISAKELKARLANPSDECIVFDCRSDLINPDAGINAYQNGHIPGALFADMNTDLSGPKTGLNGRHPLPSSEAWAKTRANWGLSLNRPIVVYDDHGAMFAARMWWMLTACGHTHVQILDGGLSAWKAIGGNLSTEMPAPNKTSIDPKSIHAEFRGLVLMNEVVDNLQSKNYLIIDARSNDRYRGENETIDPVGGRIPGAMNRFFKDNLDANGLFKSPSQLKEDFLSLLDRDPEAVIHQCGSGATACHNLFAMQLAGLSGARIYAGSWSEWCSHPNNPVATGS